MAALPPSDGQATAKVSDEEADQGVDPENMSDGAMPSIVSREHDLLLANIVNIEDAHEGGPRRTQKTPRQIAEAIYHS